MARRGESWGLDYKMDGTRSGASTAHGTRGQLKVHVCGEYSLVEAAKAQAALKHRETIGKVLLVL